MTAAIRVYAYLAPALLAPLSAWLWWTEYHDPWQFLVAWIVPIVWAYLVPAVGTNVCKVWEFDVRWKLGRFRPHHGFVFGSTTATIAWLVHGRTAASVPDMLRYALILCSVLGFWNLLYEVKALRVGLLKVYNQPWAEGRAHEAVAFDYAPWFFGGFGAAHGLSIAALELVVRTHGPVSNAQGLAWLSASLVLCVALPVLGFMRHSIKAHGHAGTRPVPRV